MAEEKCTHFKIKNWLVYQKDLTLEKQDAKLPWILDYTNREDDADFRSLSMFQRAVLEGLCRLAGRTPSRLIQNDVNYLSSALQVPAMERSRMGQAIVKLRLNSFLIPCNQPLSLRDRDREGDRDGEGEREGQNLNRSTNQPIKKRNEATPPSSSLEEDIENQNRTGTGLEANQEQQQEQEQNLQGSEDDWVLDVKDVFPHHGALAPWHKTMWFEVVAKVEEFIANLPEDMMINGIRVEKPNPYEFITNMVMWNMDHMPESGKGAGMRVRGVKSLHKAVVNSDSENGIMQQTMWHTEDTCKKCMAKKKVTDKAMGIQPPPKAEQDTLYKEKKTSDGDKFKVIARKPKNGAERRVLLDSLDNPKTRWDYVLPFLVQEGCPECHGGHKDGYNGLWVGCSTCIRTEEMFPMQFKSASAEAVKEYTERNQ